MSSNIIAREKKEQALEDATVIFASFFPHYPAQVLAQLSFVQNALFDSDVRKTVHEIVDKIDMSNIITLSPQSQESARSYHSQILYQLDGWQ